MSAAPEISVITPTKNRLSLLCETMDSVQQQDFANWEHIIVDDGSDDGTAEEVARRAAADSRVRYIRRSGEKSGASVCRNIGIKECLAELIVFLDSDDLLEPDCLGRRVERMRRNMDVDYITSQASIFVHVRGDRGLQSDPDLTGDDLLRFLFFENPWQTTAPTWRRAALERLRGFDEDLLSWQDVDLHVRAVASGMRYLRFPEVDYNFRWQFEPTKVSVEQRRSPSHLRAALSIFEKFELAVRQGPGMNWVRQRALCSLYYFVAERLADAGHLGDSVRAWRQIRVRSLGPRHLYIPGTLLLFIRSLGYPGRLVAERLSHKWRGWMRMRTNPELIAL